VHLLFDGFRHDAFDAESSTAQYGSIIHK
jgi:hypothetical protein